MKKPAKLLFTKLVCTETTGESGEDEVMFWLDIDGDTNNRVFVPSESGRFIFKKGGGTQSVNFEVDVTSIDKIKIRMRECDSSDPVADKNETIGEYILRRDDLIKAYDWENLPEGQNPPTDLSIRFDKNSTVSEISKGIFYLHYRIITNPIPTVRVLGVRCEQQSAGYNQKAVEAMLAVAEEATEEAAKVIGKSPRPRAKLIADGFKAASKVLKGVQEISDWIGRIIEGKNDEIYLNRTYSSRGYNGSVFPPEPEKYYKIQSEGEVRFEEKYGRYFRFPLDNGPVQLELREYDSGKADVNVGSITVDPEKIAQDTQNGIEAGTMTEGKAVMGGPAVIELADSYGKRDGEGALYHICYSVGYEDWNKDATTDAQGDPNDA